jgi:hypothetical protein
MNENKFEIISSLEDDGLMSHKIIWRKFEHGVITPYQLGCLLVLVASSYIKQGVDEQSSIDEFMNIMKIRDSKITSIGNSPIEERI